jgi:hypothetical protein
MTHLFLIFLTLTTVYGVPLSDFRTWPHQRIALSDVSIHFRYYGNGPPLLLIHGYPEHSVCSLSDLQKTM